MSCFQRAELQRFLAGELSAPAAAELAAHVEECAACERALAELAGSQLPLLRPGPAKGAEAANVEPTSQFLDHLRSCLAPTSGLHRAPGLTMVDYQSDQATEEPGSAAGGPITGPVPAAVPGYEVLAELSRGGMGVVYKARQVALNRVVALKMILTEGHAGQALRARFRTEAEAVARLQHPNIVQIYDVGEHAGRPYFSMELIDGPTLTAACRGQPQPPAAAAALVEVLARAVYCAHLQGIIHRDLKPDNILLVSGGVVSGAWSKVTTHHSPLTTHQPKLIDFGLAKRQGDVQLTQQGQIVGTPSYMAPEQVAAKGADVGPATDVYALGAVLYELLTGRPPFLAESVEATLMRVLREEPIPLRRLQPKVPRDLETICLKCLRKEPPSRYGSAAALADDLGRFLRGKPIVARPVGPVERAVKWVRRNPVVAGLAAALVLLLLVGAGIGLWARGRVVEQSQADHAAALVTRLRDAETVRVPDILAEFEDYRSWADPLLREELEQAAPNSRRQLHASLALLPVDAAQVAYLYQRLLNAEPQEVAVIRDALAPHQSALVAKLWTVAEGPGPGKKTQRLRAASALAAYDRESARWQTIRQAVAADLVKVPAFHLAAWLEALRPMRRQLLGPLKAIYYEPQRRELERSLATEILADYATDQPKLLAELLLDAEPGPFAVLLPKLQEPSAAGLPVLRAELARTLPATAGADDQVRLARRQANAAVALLRLGQPQVVWTLLKHSKDPTVRSYLTHRLGPLGVSARVLLGRLEDEPDLSVRRALLLSLGAFAEADVAAAERKELLPKLQEMYRTDADPGLHGAAEWLLRHWQQQAWLGQINAQWAKDTAGRQQKLERLGKQLAGDKKSGLASLVVAVTKDKPLAPPQWYVNGLGQTMVVLPGPVTFAMGSPQEEPHHFDSELLHKRRIGRSFALASKPVTVAQMRLDVRWSDKVMLKKYAPTDDCPVHGIPWFEAAVYCNWLSAREGIPREQWCYETNFGGTVTGLKPNYLSLTGYRLPTEAEMEYACRAGAVTSRYYGEGEELLENYAWYMNNAKNRSWPVGSRKPNDFGLFDMYGNVNCWCQESFQPYRRNLGDLPVEDNEDIQSIQLSRAVRSGSFLNTAVFLRSASRVGLGPAKFDYNVGFRLARTITP